MTVSARSLPPNAAQAKPLMRCRLRDRARRSEEQMPIERPQNLSAGQNSSKFEGQKDKVWK